MLLILVPAPKAAPPFPVGEWVCQWGGISQGMTFHANGSYDSPEFGSGYWSQDERGNIWFSERGDAAFYAMWLDPKTKTGTGWRHNRCEGSYDGELKVSMKRK